MAQHRRRAAPAGHRGHGAAALSPGRLVNRLHREAEILTSEHTEHGTRVEAKVNQAMVDELTAYAV